MFKDLQQAKTSNDRVSLYGQRLTNECKHSTVTKA